MVAAGRSFQGTLPLSGMSRLAPSLADTEGDAAYDLRFMRDALGVALLVVHVEAALPLICQRSLERFALPVVVETRLGLIELERDEAGLPPDCEPLLLTNGMLDPAAVVEDELVLAVPLIPVRPGSEPVATGDDAESSVEPPATYNPFADIGDLMHKN